MAYSLRSWAAGEGGRVHGDHASVLLQQEVDVADGEFQRLLLRCVQQGGGRCLLVGRW